MTDTKDYGERWMVNEIRWVKNQHDTVHKIYTTFSQSEAFHRLRVLDAKKTLNRYELIDRWADGGNTITGVAIMQDGVKYFLSAPARHHDVIGLMIDHYKIEPPVRANSPQGFVLNTGEFVTRKQARTIAVMNGQCPEPKLKEELYSEDLW